WNVDRTADRALFGQVDLVARNEHLPPDHRCAIEHLRGAHGFGKRGESRLHFLNARHRTELRELPEKLARVHRLERILVLELRDHQLEKLRLAELILLFDLAGSRRAARALCAVDDVGNGHVYSCATGAARRAAARDRATRTRLRMTRRNRDAGVLREALTTM